MTPNYQNKIVARMLKYGDITLVSIIDPKEVYNSMPEYNESIYELEEFNSENHVRYKIGKRYYAYDLRKTKPALTQIHALISRFERFLQGHG